ncbi:MAG: Xaa-Pro peptidase family protein [Thermomicrobiales bacterium]
MTDRLDRLRHVMAEHDVDAALISHPNNRRYFSGFSDADHAPDESAGYVLVTLAEATLHTSPTNLPWAMAEARDGVATASWGRPWQAVLGENLNERGIRRMLFEDLAMPVADYRKIQEKAGDVTFVPAGEAVHELRRVKEPSEIAAIARAAQITDAAFVAATENLQPGVTERELVWRIAVLMRELGADSPGFDTIVGAGPHGARPHHNPTDRPIAAGEPIVIDMGAAVDGYCADLTRTIWLGEPSPEYRSRYNTLLAVQETALRSIRAGMTGKEADAIARDALIAEGFEAQLIHGLGHGVGLNVHEWPSLGASSEDVLRPGEIVTIEPGIYFEDWGGIRIEDLAVVTDDGLDVLSAAPK